MRPLRVFLLLTLLAGFPCLPSYGLPSEIKTSRTEIQFPHPGHRQTSKNRVKTALDTPFTLQYQQKASLSTERIEILFSEITEDSRCPSDVTCMWAGQVSIRLDLIKQGRKFSTLKLTLLPGRESLATQSFDQYTVQLLQVLPYPKNGQKMRNTDYLAKILITKR
jgi:hypothetical protein